MIDRWTDGIYLQYHKKEYGCFPLISCRQSPPPALGIVIFRFVASSNPLADNVITNMGDAGIALLESEDAEIHHNTVNGAEYGIRLNLGSRDNNVYENTFNDISDGEADPAYDVRVYSERFVLSFAPSPVPHSHLSFWVRRALDHLTYRFSLEDSCVSTQATTSWQLSKYVAREGVIDCLLSALRVRKRRDSSHGSC